MAKRTGASPKTSHTLPGPPSRVSHSARESAPAPPLPWNRGFSFSGTHELVRRYNFCPADHGIAEELPGSLLVTRRPYLRSTTLTKLPDPRSNSPTILIDGRLGSYTMT